MNTKGKAHGCPSEFPPYTWFLASGEGNGLSFSQAPNGLGPTVWRGLTPLLAADAVAQAGTQHLLGALASDPALLVVVGGPGVCAAGSLCEDRPHF